MELVRRAARPSRRSESSASGSFPKASTSSSNTRSLYPVFSKTLLFSRIRLVFFNGPPSQYARLSL
jgi:hypothetical protein